MIGFTKINGGYMVVYTEIIKEVIWKLVYSEPYEYLSYFLKKY